MSNKILYLLFFISSIAFGQTKIISEEILITNDSIQLPGTLTYTNTQVPLVIWIHGSGNVDRNGNQGTVIKANYIKQVRDALNKQQIAFYSYDKRTANSKNFKFLKGIVFTDFVNDANKVIAHFKKDTRFTKIILIGHSQGSLIAMLASKNIDKYISLSGPAVSIDKTMVEQITKQNKILGEIAAQHFKELNETGTIKTVNPFLVSVFSEPNFAFLKSWAAYNPSLEIKKVQIPILILNGTKDLQVTIADAEALHAANPTSKLVLIKNMNHVLKNIEKDSDNLKSYYTADFKVSELLIKTLVAFIKK